MGNGGYDVAHYTLDLAVDVRRNQISGTATIHAQALASLASLNLDYEGPDVTAATVNGRPCRTSLAGGELILIPEEPLPSGEPFTVTVSYAGHPGAHRARGDDRYALGWYPYDEAILVASEPTGAATWYPVNDHPSDKASYTFRITVAEPWEVAANGVLRAVEEGDGARTWLWEEDDPLASYLVTLAIGDWDVEDAGVAGGVPIRNYYAPGIPESIRAYYADLPEMMAFFQDLFGPYPFETYGVAVHDVRLGFALETQSLSTFDNREPRNATIAHELAHQWCGDSVTPAAWEHIWLNEGLATYAAYLWQEHTEGPQAVTAALLDRYRTLAADYPRLSLTPAALAARVAALPLAGSDLAPERARRALSALLAGALDPAAVAALVPGDGPVSRASLPGLLANAPFGTLELGMTPWNAFVAEIGLPGEAFAVGDPGPLDLFDWRVYQRGALTLHALRARVGDEAFYEILRAWPARYRYGVATTADFVALCEEVTGADLEAFFQAWLFETALPPIPELGWDPAA